MKYKILVLLFITFLSVVIPVNADEYNDFEKQIDKLLKTYHVALEERDFETIKKISTKEFLKQSKEYWEYKIDRLIIDYIKINSYRKMDDNNQIKFNCKISFLNGKGLPSLTYKGPVAFVLLKKVIVII